MLKVFTVVVAISASFSSATFYFMHLEALLTYTYTLRSLFLHDDLTLHSYEMFPFVPGNRSSLEVYCI